MNFSKQAVNEKLDYLKRMSRGAGWDGMRAKRMREIERHYLNPLKARIKMKPGSAPALAMQKEVERVEAELKALAGADDAEAVRIATEIIEVGYLQRDGSVDGAVDFDEAVRLWAERTQRDGGATGVVLTKGQERIIRARWDKEFGKAVRR